MLIYYDDTTYVCFRLAMQSLKDSIQGIMGASSSVNISKVNQIKQGQARVYVYIYLLLEFPYKPSIAFPL